MPRKLPNFIHGAVYRSKSGQPDASASAPDSTATRPPGRTTLPTRLGSPAHSLRPRPAPTLGSGRNESAVILCRQHRDHILYQPPTLRPASTINANLIAALSLGFANGNMSGQVMDKEPMLLSRMGETRGFPQRSGRAFRHSRPRLRSPRIRRWALPWCNHRAEIRFASAGSMRRTYQGDTRFHRCAHHGRGIPAPSSPRSLRPSSYLRRNSG